MKTDVSIVIPALNEATHIRNCLDSILRQRTDLIYDVLVIDSGSTDGTRDIVSQYSNVKLVCIDPEDFGHGKTRNFGASLTAGTFIVFLNADAVPASTNWLDSLIQGFEGDDSLAGVFSRHLPRDGCSLFMERDIRSSMPEQGKDISRFDPNAPLLFSTVSCAIPRVVWQDHPFDDHILIAEDQDWAKRVLEGHLRIVYQPDSTVYHSHNYRFRELYSIKVQVGYSLKRFKNRYLNIVPGFFLAAGGFLVKFAGDTVYILSRRLPLRVKAKELWVSLGSRIASFTGRYIGWIKS
jgi:rhamnosyltransferase